MMIQQLQRKSSQVDQFVRAVGGHEIRGGRGSVCANVYAWRSNRSRGRMRRAAVLSCAEQDVPHHDKKLT